MNSTTNKEQILRLKPEFNMEEAFMAALDKKVPIFSGLFAHPKAEDVKITDKVYRYEPFWHVACRVYYKYDRTHDYDVSNLPPEVKSVTVDEKDYPVTIKSRQFTITGIEHCITEGSTEAIFDAVSGQEKQDWKTYLSFSTESLSDVSELSIDGSTFAPPEVRPRAVVQQVFSSLPQPIKANTIHERMEDVITLALYFRPVYAFEYNWVPKGKTAVAEFDGLTGEMTFSSGVTLRQQVEKVMTRDLLFDISAEAANLLIPGGGIAVRVLKEIAK